MGHAFFILAFSLLISQAPDRSGPRGARGDVHCGGYCLFTALKAIGLGPSTYEELEQRLGVPDVGGYSMLELERVARSHGAKTMAVETSLDNLLARPEQFTCLTITRDNHYILLYKIDARKVYFCDAPTLASVFRDTFEGVWSRKALLIGRESFVPEEVIESRRWWSRAKRMGVIAAAAAVLVVLLIGFAIHWRRRRGKVTEVASICVAAASLFFFGYEVRRAPAGAGAAADTDGLRPISIAGAPSPRDPPFINLGRILISQPNQVVPAAATLRNDGSKPVTIHALVPSCTCTDVGVSATRIDPGEESILRLSIRLGNNDDDGGARVRVHSDDPVRPVTEISFRWAARNQLHAGVKTIDLAQLRPGQPLKREVPILSRGLALCRECQFQVSDSLAELYCQFQPTLESTERSHARAIPREDVPLGRLLLAVSPSEEGGHRQGTIHLAVRCGVGDRAFLDLPIIWRVEPRIAPYPERLYLGSTGPGARLRCTVLLSSKEGNQFTLSGVEHSGSGSLVSQEFDREPAMIHEVKVEIEAPQAAGAWSAVLYLSTDDQEVPRVSVPVAGLVEADDED